MGGLNRIIRGLKRSIVFIGLGSGLAGCGVVEATHDAFLLPNRVDADDKAASVLVTATTVAPWSDVSAALKPNFTLSGSDAVADVLPITETIQQATLNSSGVGVTAGNVQPNILAAAGSGVSASAPAQTSALPSNVSLPTVPTSGVALDPSLKYKSAAYLIQLVQLLNQEIDSVALRDCYVPYVVKLKIGIMPYRPKLPYSVHTHISFVQTPGVGVDPQYKMLNVSTSSCPSGKSPEVVPLLAADDLDVAARQSAAEEAQQLSLSLSYLQLGTAANANLGHLHQALTSIANEDLSSKLTVSRDNDNTLYVEVQPNNISSGDPALVGQTYDIAVLLLLPRAYFGEGDGKPAPMSLVTYTQFRDAKTGTVLKRRSDDDEVVQLNAALTPYLSPDQRSQWSRLSAQEKLDRVRPLMAAMETPDESKFRAYLGCANGPDTRIGTNGKGSFAAADGQHYPLYMQDIINLTPDQAKTIFGAAAAPPDKSDQILALLKTMSADSKTGQDDQTQKIVAAVQAGDQRVIDALGAKLDIHDQALVAKAKGRGDTSDVLALCPYSEALWASLSSVLVDSDYKTAGFEAPVPGVIGVDPQDILVADDGTHPISVTVGNVSGKASSLLAARLLVNHKAAKASAIEGLSCPPSLDASDKKKCAAALSKVIYTDFQAKMDAAVPAKPAKHAGHGKGHAAAPAAVPAPAPADPTSPILVPAQSIAFNASTHTISLTFPSLSKYGVGKSDDDPRTNKLSLEVMGCDADKQVCPSLNTAGTRTTDLNIHLVTATAPTPKISLVSAGNAIVVNNGGAGTLTITLSALPDGETGALTVTGASVLKVQDAAGNALSFGKYGYPLAKTGVYVVSLGNLPPSASATISIQGILANGTKDTNDPVTGTYTAVANMPSLASIAQ